jgi:hypothetical protein
MPLSMSRMSTLSLDDRGSQRLPHFILDDVYLWLIGINRTSHLEVFSLFPLRKPKPKSSQNFALFSTGVPLEAPKRCSKEFPLLITEATTLRSHLEIWGHHCPQIPPPPDHLPSPSLLPQD